MSTHSAEFGSGSLSPDEIARAAEERDDDRRTSSGDHYQVTSPSADLAGSSDRASAPPAARRARYVRPRLPDFTGIANTGEGVYGPDEVIPDDPEAEAASRRARIKDLIEGARAKLAAQSEPKPTAGFRYNPPVSPAELAQQGQITSYTDAHGYDVVTLRDPRDPNQRYDPRA